MVHFSGFARKMNHIPPPRTSEASARRVLEFYVAFQSCFLLSILINYIIIFFSENFQRKPSFNRFFFIFI
ncbi:MAG: hypothetical protein U5L45_14550 [Saprospiraceae bacterium]|nr:hypothetical protein [Saprospiraceae bacterium]